MDYSKYGISKKKQQLNSGAKRAGKKVGFTVFRVFLICFILIAVVGVSAGIGGFVGVIESAPEININDVAPKDFKSYIYYDDGTPGHEISDSDSNRIYVTIDQISENLQNAFIALEDERFRTHNGIDPKGIVRAFFVGIKNGGNFTEGASTITQQLLKLSIFSGGEEQNQLLRFKRKFQEQYLALELEKMLSKDEILEAYLNTINLGQGNYGVETASNYYFNKSASDLTVAESAVLASIAQSPTNNNPVTNPDVNRGRQQTTIKYMYEQGLISEQEYNDALADTDIYSRIASNAASYSAKKQEVYTYYEEAAIKQVIQDLQDELGYTETEATDMVYSKGLKIYLDQDREIQSICDKHYMDDSYFPETIQLLTYAISIYDDPDSDQTRNYNTSDLNSFLDQEYAFYTSKDDAMADIQAYKDYLGINENTKYTENISFSPQIQSSFVIIDQKTGYVSAVIAGRGEKNGNMVLNRATMSTRQPGSVFKIVSTYAPAIDACGDSLSSTKVDEPVETYGGHTVNNVDFKYTHGPVSFRDAIIWSKNTIATLTLREDVTTNLALDYLIDKFHFTTLDRQSDAVEALAIGGITTGVTNLELTASFASIANQGTYVRPVFYTKVLDASGNILLDNTDASARSSQAIKASTAYFLTDAMKGVVTESGGTGLRANLSGMTTAGKTGTTDDHKDMWFVGYTPYYTAGIWYGYDNNISPENRVAYNDYYRHQTLWKNIMDEINQVKGLQNKDFEKPDSIVSVTVCKYSGLKPGSGCAETTTAVFDKDNVPTETCDECAYVNVCGVCHGIAAENSTEVYYKRYNRKTGDGKPSYVCTCLPAESETETPDDENDDPVVPGDDTPGRPSTGGGTTNGGSVGGGTANGGTGGTVIPSN